MRCQAGRQMTESEPLSPCPHPHHPSSPPDAHLCRSPMSKKNTLKRSQDGWGGGSGWLLATSCHQSNALPPPPRYKLPCLFWFVHVSEWLSKFLHASCVVEAEQHGGQKMSHQRAVQVRHHWVTLACSWLFVHCWSKTLVEPLLVCPILPLLYYKMGPFVWGNVRWGPILVTQPFCELLMLMGATRSSEWEAISRPEVPSMKEELLLLLGLP